MKLILKTHCTNEFFDGCSYALVDLTPALARTILRRREIVDAVRRNDPDLTETRYYSGDAVYFSSFQVAHANLLDEIERAVADRGFAQPRSDFHVGDEFLERTECDQMVISRDGVWFECYPKHCDPLVETREIDFETVQEALNEQGAVSSDLSHQPIAEVRDQI
jgi:hypothetical protein